MEKPINPLSMWQWLSSKIGFGLDLSPPISLIPTTSQISSQVMDVVLASVINVVWFLWQSKNNICFQSCHVSPISIQHNVLAAFREIFQRERCTLTCKSLIYCIRLGSQVIPKSMFLLNKFLGKLHLLVGLRLINTDGAAHGSSSVAACGDIFRDKKGHFLGGFVLHIGISNAFSAEVHGGV